MTSPSLSHSTLPFARRSPALSRSAAFTLIELLTVIAIIAILMGILFPVINNVKENAKKVQAKNDVTQIVTAVKAYYTEYGKYPPVPGSTQPNADTVLGRVGGSST